MKGNLCDVVRRDVLTSVYTATVRLIMLLCINILKNSLPPLYS